MAEETNNPPERNVALDILNENGWSMKEGKIIAPQDIQDIENQRITPITQITKVTNSDYGAPLILAGSAGMVGLGARYNYNRILADELKNYQMGTKLAKQAVAKAVAGQPLNKIIDAKGNPVPEQTLIVFKGGKSPTGTGKAGKFASGQSSRVGTIYAPSVGVEKADTVKAIKAETWKRFFSGVTASGTTTSPLVNPPVMMNVLKNGKVSQVAISAEDVLSGTSRAPAALEATRYAKITKGAVKIPMVLGSKLAQGVAHPFFQIPLAALDAYSSYHNSGVAYDEQMNKSGDKTQATLDAMKEYLPLAIQAGTFVSTKNPWARTASVIPSVGNALGNWLGNPNHPDMDMLNLPSMQAGRKGLMNWDGPEPEHYPQTPSEPVVYGM